MTNYLKAIKVTYLSATNTKGFRIKLSVPLFDDVIKPITLDRCYKYNHAEQIERHLISKGFNIVAVTETKEVTLYLVDTLTDNDNQWLKLK